MKIGDIKSDKLYKKYMWVACPDCGVERWVIMRKGKPENVTCHYCATQRVSGKPVIRYPIRSMREAYIQDYGMDLENRFDVAENINYKRRIFCLDCGNDCLDWEDCIIRAEVLKIIKEV